MRTCGSRSGVLVARCMGPDGGCVCQRRAAVRRRFPGDAAQAGRPRRLVQVRHHREPDRRSRRGDLGPGADAAHQSGPSPGATGARRPLLPARLLRDRPHLSRNRPEITGLASRCAQPGRAVHGRGREAPKPLAFLGRAVPRHPLPVQRQSRSRDVGGPAVRADRQPEPAGPRDVGLGLREFGAVSPFLRSRPSGQVGDREPAHGLCQSPVQPAGGECLADRLHDRTSLPGVPGHFRGRHPEAVPERRLHLGQRPALLRQLWRRAGERRAAGGQVAQRLDLQLAPAELSQYHSSIS